MDRTSLIKRIQFILFDEYDYNIGELNNRYLSDYYNFMNDQQLWEYYTRIHNEKSEIL
jgi:hypothetical protein